MSILVTLNAFDTDKLVAWDFWSPNNPQSGSTRVFEVPPYTYRLVPLEPLLVPKSRCSKSSDLLQRDQSSLGPSLGPLWFLLGPLWVHHGPLWNLLGPLWVHHGFVWNLPGPLWGFPGPLLGPFGVLGSTSFP